MWDQIREELILRSARFEGRIMGEKVQRGQLKRFSLGKGEYRRRGEYRKLVLLKIYPISVCIPGPMRVRKKG